MIVKEKLDAALRHRVMEIEKYNQIQEANKEIIKPESMSKRQKEIYNRKMIKIIESRVKIEKPKEPTEDLYEAYRLLLSEHHRRAMKRLQNISSINLMEEMSISTPKIDAASHSAANDAKTLGNTNSQNKIKNGKQGTILNVLLRHNEPVTLYIYISQ